MKQKTKRDTWSFRDGKIFVITDGQRVYVGSTVVKNISDCLFHYRFRYRRYKRKLKHDPFNPTGYHPTFHIFENISMDHCNIFLLERFPCDSRHELNEREAYWKDIRSRDILSILFPDSMKT